MPITFQTQAHRSPRPFEHGRRTGLILFPSLIRVHATICGSSAIPGLSRDSFLSFEPECWKYSKMTNSPTKSKIPRKQAQSISLLYPVTDLLLPESFPGHEIGKQRKVVKFFCDNHHTGTQSVEYWNCSKATGNEVNSAEANSSGMPFV